MTAFQYTRDGLTAIFQHLGIEVEDKFGPLEQALRRALYANTEATTPSRKRNASSRAKGSRPSGYRFRARSRSRTSFG